MSDDVAIVTCMHVNNIHGSNPTNRRGCKYCAPISQGTFSRRCRYQEAIGKVPLCFEGVDTLSLSGHKFHAV